MFFMPDGNATNIRWRASINLSIRQRPGNARCAL